jgi:hypothetical protein
VRRPSDLLTSISDALDPRPFRSVIIVASATNRRVELKTRDFRFTQLNRQGIARCGRLLINSQLFIPLDEKRNGVRDVRNKVY